MKKNKSKKGWKCFSIMHSTDGGVMNTKRKMG